MDGFFVIVPQRPYPGYQTRDGTEEFLLQSCLDDCLGTSDSPTPWRDGQLDSEQQLPAVSDPVNDNNCLPVFDFAAFDNREVAAGPVNALQTCMQLLTST